MKRILWTIILLLSMNSVSAFAKEERTIESVVGLPKTYTDSGLHIMSIQDEFDERMRQGWETLEPSIDVSDLGITLSDYAQRYESAKHNNPLYFYVANEYSVSYYPATGVVAKINPAYTYDRENADDMEELQNILAEIESETEEILFSIDDGMSDFEKVMTVHDYMVLNYDYDTAYKNHTITIMTTKTGVCESYAYAFMYVMNRLGIETNYVSSESMNHAWNLVKIDGEWYHIDLTWDDPVDSTTGTGYFAQTRHTYALLSSDRISSLTKPHYDFDLDGLTADSTAYDDMVWHNSNASIVCIDDISYWISGNDIVNENGDVIHESLDGDDAMWNITSKLGFKNAIYAGLAEYNGKLYFNTDSAVHSYNPHDGKNEIVKQEIGICGLYIDKNDLRYCEFNILFDSFFNAGMIHLGDAKIGVPHVEGDKVTVKILHEEDSDDVITFASGGNHCQVQKATESGLTEVEFDIEDTLTLFFWDSNMRPLKEKETLILN